MTQPHPFRAVAPWNPQRPKTLVMCCSDGRWRPAIIEYVTTEIDAHADLYVVPGGPVVCDAATSSIDEASVFDSSLQVLAEFHDLKVIWLIAHEGCAYYEVKHPHLQLEQRIGRQHEDLLVAARHVRGRLPGREVWPIYARLEHGRIVFEPVVVPSAEDPDGRARTGVRC